MNNMLFIIEEGIYHYNIGAVNIPRGRERGKENKHTHTHTQHTTHTHTQHTHTHTHTHTYTQHTHTQKREAQKVKLSQHTMKARKIHEVKEGSVCHEEVSE